MTDRKFPKNPKLETKRLILRKPKRSDWKDLVEGLNDIQVARETKVIPNPYGKKDAIKFIKDARKKFRKRKGYPLFLELKGKEKVIGCIDIGNIKKFNGTATTGSWVNRRYWQNGYMTEAKISANSFVFNELGLRRLESEVFVGNKASEKTQKRMGYKHEGTKRKAIKSKSTGKIRDTEIYGLLKEDWDNKREKVKEHLDKKINKQKSKNAK